MGAVRPGAATTRSNSPLFVDTQDGMDRAAAISASRFAAVDDPVSGTLRSTTWDERLRDAKDGGTTWRSAAPAPASAPQSQGLAGFDALASAHATRSASRIIS